MRASFFLRVSRRGRGPTGDGRHDETAEPSKEWSRGETETGDDAGTAEQAPKTGDGHEAKPRGRADGGRRSEAQARQAKREGEGGLGV